MYPQVPTTTLSLFKKTSAFSLIELMVVVAIIATLGTFALPVVASTSWQTPYGAHAYQDYTVRTRVAEVISWSEGIRKQIADNVSNGLPFSSGLQSTTSGTPKYLKSLAISGSNGNSTSTTIPFGGIYWTCRSDESGIAGVTSRGTLPGKYTPPSCTEKIVY